MSDKPDNMDENGELTPELLEKLNSGELSIGELLGLSPETQYEMAKVAYRLFQTGQLEQALNVYEGLTALSPRDSTFHCHLGATLYALDRLDHAFTAYDQALNLDSNNIDALVGRGELHLRNGRSAQGLADLKKAVELDREKAHQSTFRARSTVIALEQQVKTAQNPGPKK